MGCQETLRSWLDGVRKLQRKPNTKDFIYLYACGGSHLYIDKCNALVRVCVRTYAAHLKIVSLCIPTSHIGVVFLSKQVWAHLAFLFKLACKFVRTFEHRHPASHTGIDVAPCTLQPMWPNVFSQCIFWRQGNFREQTAFSCVIE